MKSPLLLAAVALLVVSNAFVLAHVAMNRSGQPDSEIDLSARELQYQGSRSDDSSVVLTLHWENTAPEYLTVGQTAPPGWFDQKKLEELGFDLSVPASSPRAQRFYVNLRSREAFVALEFEGPEWEQWLKDRDSQFQRESQYAPQVSVTDRAELERQTASRLVAIDVARDPAELRRKYPDRKRVMILPALVRAMLEPDRRASPSTPARAAYLRGAITRIPVESINVPDPLSRQFDGQPSYVPYTYEGKQMKIQPPTFRATVRVGSKYEPWVTDVKTDVKPLR